MASLMTIKLNKAAGVSWGFRLQGGKDFATPLCIQKVNVGSVAEQSGLQAGDAIVSINGQDGLALRHKEAQDTIVRAGNVFDIVIQRGTQIWRPSVTALPEKSTLSDGAPVATKTSLVADPKPPPSLGLNYNCVPRPFCPSFTANGIPPVRRVKSPHISPQGNLAVQSSPVGSLPLLVPGTDIELDRANARAFLELTLRDDVSFSKKNDPKEALPNGDQHRRQSGHNGLTNGDYSLPINFEARLSNSPSINSSSSNDDDDKLQQQYNSPVNIYSDDSIAETLSAQAEVLDKGVLGVNFMKNDKDYDGQASDVLRMVQEMDGAPAAAPSPTPGTPIPHSPHPVYCEADGRPVAQGHSFKLLESVLNDGDSETPVRSVASPANHAAPFATEGVRVVTGCAICERPITGVFVRVKNKNLHAECFKCSTCAASLKNVGYYNINERLYCDVHAKQAARTNPPAPGMEPVTVAPGHPTPSGMFTSPQAKAAAPAPASPSPAQVSSPIHQATPPMAQSPAEKEMEVDAPTVKSGDQTKEMTSPLMQRPVASPVAAPKPVSPAPPKPLAAPPAANPHSFGAPAGDVNVRTHIPKKGDLPGFGAPTMPNFGAPSMPNFGAPPMPNFGAPSMPLMPSLPIITLPSVVPQGPPPAATGGPARGILSAGQRSAPKRGRGVMNPATGSPRIPMCAICQRQIRGPFVSALGKTWCPDHFVCATSTCKKNIIDLGFVEERGGLYCEFCYESYLAPVCGKCDKRIKGDCLNAVGKQFHPECFCCAYCGKVFGSGAFYLEDGLPYCETDWNDLFTTKCIGCSFPIEAGDRWVEALNNNYHSQCFKCSKCHKNLEGQSFFAKGGKPFCKTHAQRGF